MHPSRTRPPFLLVTSPNFTIATGADKVLTQSYLDAVFKMAVSAYLTLRPRYFLGGGELDL